VWLSVGSDNVNRRSWTHDSELSCAVVDEERDKRDPRDPAGLGDGARTLARELRLTLAREHLGRQPADDGDLVDPEEFCRAMAATADRLDEWHTNGCQGERPPGQLRRHRDAQLGRGTRLLARPLYRLVYDPDGRPWRLRRTGRF